MSTQKSPLRIAIDAGLSGVVAESQTHELLIAYLDAPEHLNVSVMVMPLFSPFRNQNPHEARVELPSCLLPPL